ncbi:MAG TPA: ADP-ribosylglycohydrolase family protein [Cyanothece sp. UBA12306]|nr:ADP-ribosylglycohydrolase family protein [Cyanothece sp. UBA12306]
MRYSLYSRFQGTLIGSLIGLELEKKNPSEIGWLNLNYKLIKMLAQKGEISTEDWLILDTENPLSSPNYRSMNLGELMLGILPLILFFHDAPSLLEEQLQPLIVKGKDAPEKQEILKIWVQLLILILTENVPVNNIISHLLTNHSCSCQFLIEQLETAQQFLAQKTPLNQVKDHFVQQSSLEQSALILGLYCFIGTPEEFALSLRRAYQLKSPVIIALTGAIAGAYNSIDGIPNHWHLAWKQSRTSEDIRQTIGNFWAMWTGVSSLEGINWHFEDIAVNSPGIMQKCLSMKLISQKQYFSGES